jgi:hypothetical protein
VHELLALMVGQSVWMIWAGVLMIRKCTADNSPS